MKKKFKMLNLMDPNHNWLAVQLTVEWAINGEWVDIRGNLVQPIEKLPEPWARMVSVLQSMGVKTQAQFDEWIRGYEALFQVKHLLFNTFKNMP